MKLGISFAINKRLMIYPLWSGCLCILHTFEKSAVFNIMNVFHYLGWNECRLGALRSRRENIQHVQRACGTWKRINKHSSRELNSCFGENHLIDLMFACARCVNEQCRSRHHFSRTMLHAFYEIDSAEPPPDISSSSSSSSAKLN